MSDLENIAREYRRRAKAARQAEASYRKVSETNLERAEEQAREAEKWENAALEVENRDPEIPSPMPVSAIIDGKSQVIGEATVVERGDDGSTLVNVNLNTPEGALFSAKIWAGMDDLALSIYGGQVEDAVETPNTPNPPKNTKENK